MYAHYCTRTPVYRRGRYLAIGIRTESPEESSSKSKTLGSICIRWKIRKKLEEFQTLPWNGLKFRNWKLETYTVGPLDYAVHVGQLRWPLSFVTSYYSIRYDSLPSSLRGKLFPHFRVLSARSSNYFEWTLTTSDFSLFLLCRELCLLDSFGGDRFAIMCVSMISWSFLVWEDILGILLLGNGLQW